MRLYSSLLPSLRRPSKGPKGPAVPSSFPKGPLATAHRPSAPRSRAKATRARGPTRVWRDAAAILKPPATLARETRKLCTPYLHTHVRCLRNEYSILDNLRASARGRYYHQARWHLAPTLLASWHKLGHERRRTAPKKRNQHASSGSGDRANRLPGRRPELQPERSPERLQRVIFA